MWTRGIFLITIAMFVDFLQLALGWIAFAIGTGLQALTPAGGAIGGAAAGAALCYNSTTGIFAAVIAAGKCAVGGALVGAGLSAFGMPIGFLLGILFDICISLTLGSGLILLLIVSGMFYPKYVWSGGIFELMPGFDVIPGWTVMVVLCLLKKRGEEGSGGIVTATAKIVSTMGAMSATNPASALRTAGSIKNTVNQVRADLRPANDNKEGRVPLNLKSPRMNDVTPRSHAANDNHPYVQKAA